MNAAAWFVTYTGRYEHITPVLSNTLHWQPVPQQIIFYIAMLTFHSVCGTCPAYFKDVCMPLAAMPGRTSLRAADRGDLVSYTKTKIGSRSFSIAATTVWNSRVTTTSSSQWNYQRTTI